MSDALPPLAGRWGSDPSNPWGPPLPTRSASCFPVPPQTSLTWLGRSPSPGFLRKRSAMSVFVRACTCVGGRVVREARRNWFLRQPGAGRRQHPLPQVRGQVPGLARECLPSLTPPPPHHLLTFWTAQLPIPQQSGLTFHVSRGPKHVGQDGSFTGRRQSCEKWLCKGWACKGMGLCSTGVLRKKVSCIQMELCQRVLCLVKRRSNLIQLHTS